MYNDLDYEKAREVLLGAACTVGTERVKLSECAGRVLAQELIAEDNVPAFDRSPYDGYALRSADTAYATRKNPVRLAITEEIPAGSVASKALRPGFAAKILTGAPIPEGADAVIMFEKTEFTAECVSVFEPVKPGDNIVTAGEDVKKGEMLASPGDIIDPALAGTLAAQGVAEPLVYKKPRVAVISTGSELVEADCAPAPGKIRNTNRYTFEAALRRIGCEPVYMGIAGDGVETIADMLNKALEGCDAVLTTGGVSVGDYDLTPAAMEKCGAEILIRGVKMKPGMACAYAERGGKLIFGLSGNPASSLTSFYAVAAPALRKLCGRADCLPRVFSVGVSVEFKKKSPVTRFLRGRLYIDGSRARMELSSRQGNAVLSSAIGCDMMAIVPAGTPPLSGESTLKGFLV